MKLNLLIFLLDMSQEGSIDPGEGTSGLETDARAVNRATLIYQGFSAWMKVSQA